MNPSDKDRLAGDERKPRGDPRVEKKLQRRVVRGRGERREGRCPLLMRVGRL